MYALVRVIVLGLCSGMAYAADNASDQDITDAQAWAVHGQVTNVTQKHPDFRSPYSGPNSLIANARAEETTDVTLYVGVRLWSGAELWLNPEIDQGFGLSNTVGMAGFPSGEAYKIGANTPYLRLPRAFIRQVIPLGGDLEKIEASANQLGGSNQSDNLILTFGKFSVVDIFDTNSYAHDPRADFLNWSVIDAGAFDYAADAWGFTYGVAAEWTRNVWTLRGGLFQLSKEPNGKITGVDFSQFMAVGEFEHRHKWQGHPGKLKIMAFANRGSMANYRDAIQMTTQTGGIPSAASVRRLSTRLGFVINAEQEVASDFGVFVRASMNDGSKEAYEFTEINKSLSAGVSVKGDRWGRGNDTIGIAGVVNGMSAAAEDYFKAGGIGILIGDGKLNYGAEKIVETYYLMRMTPNATLALNYQHVNNPAYNKDRGPVSILGFRVHLEF
ncbi:carbohydrate porin [Massilia putida]|uniref:carbohydrate porin n=1 Tax=Massilia putida TaxID=1141883 RepID=UPI0009526B4A